MKQGTPEYFWKRIRVGLKEECWPFTGSLTRRGYGQISFCGKYFRAHRLAYVLHYQVQIPDNMLVMHTCNNPVCCNPFHLKVGTPQENVAQAGKEGFLSRPGTANGRAKFSEEEVEKIRRSKLSGASLADIYGVNKSTINRIKRSVRYK